jgi:hypothetical protein
MLRRWVAKGQIRCRRTLTTSALPTVQPTFVDTRTNSLPPSAQLRNTQMRATSSLQLLDMRQKKWELWNSTNSVRPVSVPLGGTQRLLRPGLTFTPYANAVPCNAHCGFCSEDLRRETPSAGVATGAAAAADTKPKRLKANSKAPLIRNYQPYFASLQRCLDALRAIPVRPLLSASVKVFFFFFFFFVSCCCA